MVGEACETDHDGLVTEIIHGWTVQAIITPNIKAVLQNQAASRYGVIEIDHGLDVGIDPSFVSMSSGVPPTLEKIGIAIGGKPDVDRARYILSSAWITGLFAFERTTVRGHRQAEKADDKQDNLTGVMANS